MDGAEYQSAALLIGQCETSIMVVALERQIHLCFLDSSQCHGTIRKCEITYINIRAGRIHRRVHYMNYRWLQHLRTVQYYGSSGVSERELAR